MSDAICTICLDARFIKLFQLVKPGLTRAVVPASRTVGNGAQELEFHDRYPILYVPVAATHLHSKGNISFGELR